MAIMLTCGSCHGLTPDGSSITCLHCDAALTIAPPWARRLAWVFGPVGAVLLAACYGPSGRYRQSEPSGTGEVDRDRDGAFVRDCSNLKDYPSVYEKQQCENRPPLANADCDDNDPTRYPGAQDVDGDGIDQNCDGVDGWKDPAKVAVPAVDATPE